MIETKAFEIRDRGTFIPAIGTLIEARPNELRNLRGGSDEEECEAEAYLFGRAGFGGDGHVILTRLTDIEACYDPFEWPRHSRTMHVAHKYIQERWIELESGAVICVETILGERETPKVSERLE